MPDLHEYVSDRLTHFVGGKKSPEEQYQLLLLIIRSGELKIPNSKIKSLEFDHSNKLSSNQLLKPNCVCFCDIPDVAFEIHMNKYSRFGLSFFRKFVADQGAIPVHYISTASVKKEDILHPPGGHADRSVGESYDEFFADWCSIIFNALHKDQSIPAAKKLGLTEFVHKQLFGHMKFFDHSIAIDDIENVYMEREWRLFGRLVFQVADIAKVILPASYEQRFKTDCPDFPGEMLPVPEYSS